jgi:hypothetical protein
MRFKLRTIYASRNDRHVSLIVDVAVQGAASAHTHVGLPALHFIMYVEHHRYHFTLPWLG